MKRTFQSCLLIAACLFFVATMAFATAPPGSTDLGNTYATAVSLTNLETGQFVMVNFTGAPYVMNTGLATMPTSYSGNVAHLYARNLVPATTPPFIGIGNVAMNPYLMNTFTATNHTAIAGAITRGSTVASAASEVTANTELVAGAQVVAKDHQQSTETGNSYIQRLGMPA